MSASEIAEARANDEAQMQQEAIDEFEDDDLIGNWSYIDEALEAWNAGDEEDF